MSVQSFRIQGMTMTRILSLAIFCRGSEKFAGVTDGSLAQSFPAKGKIINLPKDCRNSASVANEATMALTDDC